jgi:hypothetical protein
MNHDSLIFFVLCYQFTITLTWIKELSAACHELGLGFGFYYSHNQDWTYPAGTGGPKLDDKGQETSFKDYFYNKCKPQVKEICTNYGDIDFVWFDTPGDMKKEYVVELANRVRELQPNAMMSSRVGHGMGDYSSNGDMEVPTKNIEGLWEICDTNTDSWSYAWYDNNFKSPKEIDDNSTGPGLGEYYSVGEKKELKGRKRSLFAGGVRIPFIVRWPGQVPAGKINKTTQMSAVDLLPTFLELAETNFPKGYNSDGESIVKALKGEEFKREKPIYWDWRYSSNRPYFWPSAGIQDNNWKLLTK